MKLTINDLTKTELLELIHHKCLDHYFNANDIKWIRAQSMVDKARKVMDDAVEKMNKLRGIENLDRYLEESKRWDQGKELWEEAQRFMDGG